MKIYTLLLIIFFSISCSSTKKGFGADPAADFSSYNTYAFSSSSTSGVKSISKKRVLSAIQSEMAIKGLQAAEAPDVLIDVVFTKNESSEASKTEVKNPWRFGAWAGFEGTYTYINVQKEASLIISMVDAETKKMIWVGSSKKALGKDMASTPSAADIDKMVKKILKHYPPKIK